MTTEHEILAALRASPDVLAAASHLQKRWPAPPPSVVVEDPPGRLDAMRAVMRASRLAIAGLGDAKPGGLGAVRREDGVDVWRIYISANSPARPWGRLDVLLELPDLLEEDAR